MILQRSPVGLRSVRPPCALCRDQALLRWAVCVALGGAPFGASLAAQPAGLLAHPTQPWTNARIDPARTNAQQLTIQQTQPKAILNWSQFNVRAAESVHFEQQSASWAALNRIHQTDPSRIQGSINARGQVYLINQNGIVFANGAQVNVGGLVASTVDIADTLFDAGVLGNRQPGQVPAFGTANLPSGTVVVEHGAELRTAREGRIMLIGRDVSNNGLIATPDGQTVLAAGGKVYLAASTDPALRGLLVEVDNGGTASNLPLGRIVAERGNVTMVGLAVNQGGRITATTSVNLNGSVRLLARDSVQAKEPEAGVQIPVGTRGGDVRLGAGSLTEVKPEYGSSETSKDNQTFNRSRVDVAGQTIRMDSGAAVVAPSGVLSMTAQRGQDFQPAGAPADAGARIYIDKGAVIDVSGTRDVVVPMSRNVIDVELRGTELADSALQRDGVLKGRTVQVDVRKGTPLANIAGNLAQIARAVEERTTAGGSVALRSEGDVILRDGSVVDVSGGSVRYQPGAVKTTRLVTADGAVVDVSAAAANVVYKEVFDGYTVGYGKWGVTRTFEPPVRIEPGYVDGANAGSIAVLAHAAVLDGQLLGAATVGRLQRESGNLPTGATLVVGDSSQAGAAVPAFKIPDVNFTFATAKLDSGFSYAVSEAPGSPLAPLPERVRTTLQLPVGVLRSGGFGRLAVYSDGVIRIAEDQSIDLEPGGRNGAGTALTLVARQVLHDGRISAPGGVVVLRTVQPLDSMLPATDYALRLGAESSISTAGNWTNDHASAASNVGSAAVAIDGGSIVLASVSDLVLREGSRLDVSAGGWRQVDGRLKLGAAGSITLSTGRVNLGPFDRQASVLTLGADLRGYGYAKGGTLAIDTSQVRIGATSGPSGSLHLTPGFFTQGGFSTYQVNGQDGLTVADGTAIGVRNDVRLLDRAFMATATGSPVERFSSIVSLPELQRVAASVTLGANSVQYGNVLIGTEASLDVGAGGSIAIAAGNQLTLHGALAARGGTISLTTADPRLRDYDATQSIWLGPQAHLDARGSVRIVADDRGVRSGEVRSGGTVTLDARTGYVVMQRGALIDVSAVSGEMDLQGAAGGARASTLVHGDAGVVRIAAQEGILLEGTLRGAAAASTSAAGGSLTLALDAPVAGNASYPTAPRRVVVGGRTAIVPPSLLPGQIIDAQAITQPEASERSHRVLYAEGAFAAGGFDRITLRSPDLIEFADGARLAARLALALEAPTIAAAPGASAEITTHYLNIVNPTTFAPRAPVAGNGVLVASAGLVDIEGRLTLSGWASTLLRSQGDVRFKGTFFETGAAELVGSLGTAGSLRIDASQVYPTSAASFLVEAVGAGSRIGIGRDGAVAPSPVLSAAGSLTLKAETIEQAGVVKAPLGRIVLDASDTLTLAPGSVTSVSGEGETVLFGRTELSGRNYVYGLGPSTNAMLTAVPDKRIELRSAALGLMDGAVIDVSGGGDLRAYEFVTGPGGTRDVLSATDAPGTFAILPTLPASQWYAPYDHQEYRSGTPSALRVGDAVQLADSAVFNRTDSPLLAGMADASRTLAAGTYTLLPARYGLLPGAFLVNVAAGTTDRPPGDPVQQADGSRLLSGYLASASVNGWLRAARSVGFSVRPAETARVQSEYRETSIASVLAPAGNVLTPADAGALSVSAGVALVFDADVRTAHANGASGARIDIAAPLLAVADASSSGVPGGYLRIDPARLNALHADSVLLGATRQSVAAGTRLDVRASDVLVAKTDAATLTAAEIVLASTDTVSVADGARLVGRGIAGSRPSRLLIGDPTTSGNGALLRVASDAQVEVVRSNADGARGSLSVASGATLVADGSLLLDATRDSVLGGNLELAPGGELALSAGRVSLGETGLVTQGLRLDTSQLSVLSSLEALTLRSYSTIDFYGNVTLGSTSLDRLGLHAAGIGGYRGSTGGAHADVGVRAREIRLGNERGAVAGGPPLIATGSEALFGQGEILLDADRIEIASGGASDNVRGVAWKGFDRVRLVAGAEIVGSGVGALNVEGDLVLDAGRVTVATGGTHAWHATGAMRVGSVSSAQSLGPNPSLGATLTLEGRSVDVSGTVDLPSGRLTVSAHGPQPTDGVMLGDGARLAATGQAVRFDGEPVFAPGGEIRLAAASGDVRIGVGARVDVSSPLGGQAGRLAVAAPNGTFALDGVVFGAAGGGGAADVARQGSFSLDVRALDDIGTLNRSLNASPMPGAVLVAGGFDAHRSLRVRSGNVTIAQDDTVRAHDFVLQVEDGDLRVDGRIDASGAQGGRIELHAGEISAGRGNLTVTGVLDARATTQTSDPGTATGRGGMVFLGIASNAPGTGQGSATSARIVLAPTSVIDVGGAAVSPGGSVRLRAPRLGAGAGSGVAVQPLAGSIAGAASVEVEAYKVYNANAITATGATVDGGNFNVSTTGAAANTLAFRETGTFMGNAGAIRTALGQSGNTVFHLHPGIEIRSSGDLTVNVNETAAQHLRGWNLAPWRFGGEPGVLTLRAAGDIRLNSSIGDGFDALTNQPMQNWTTQRADRSWSYRAAAGADLRSAAPLTVRESTGDVVLAATKLLRTGTGSIELAAGRDLRLAASTAVIYTAGRTGPEIPGYASPTYRNESNGALRAAYPVDGGLIRIAAGRDITGVAGSQFISDWLMQRAAQRSSDGSLAALNAQTTWWPRVQTFEQGIATLAGGDILAVAGRNVENVSFAAPTSGVLAGPADAAADRANLVVRGGGDVRIAAGNDIVGGIYLAMAGEVALRAGGSVRAGTRAGSNNASLSVAPVLALGDATASVQATRDVALGAVVDPTLLPQRLRASGTPLGGRDLNAFASFGASTAIRAVSASGDVALINDDNVLAQSAPQIFGANTSQPVLQLYPGTLQVAALRGDVDVQGALTLFPAANGNLDLLAYGAVRSSGTIKMSDLSPSSLPNLAAPAVAFVSGVLNGQGRYDAGVAVHSNPPLHAGDATPVRIVAASGDIRFDDAAQLILPKPVRMVAGGDIRDPDLGLQHLRPSDVSVLAAGRDIVSTSPSGPSGIPGANDRTILVSGPGELQLSAGRDVDLGTSSGIVTRGALDNPALPEQGASIVVRAGASVRSDPDAFLAAYVDAGGASAARYGRELGEFVRVRLGDPSLSDDQALVRFRALAPELRASFAQQVLMAELTSAGRAATQKGELGALRRELVRLVREQTASADLSEDAALTVSRALPPDRRASTARTAMENSGSSAISSGFDAVERYFPGSMEQPAGGDINLFFSQIKTEQGGDIRLLAPIGLVNAGLANQGRFSKSARDLGIVTIAGGSIEALSREDFLVNQSRVFTLGGGDIALWSSFGNIDAGRGSKTAAATPPPQFKIDGNGVFTLDISQSIAGSGIGVLIARPGVAPGDADLVAPFGEINAGDAGIRSAGNLNVAAFRVVDNGNIAVSGRSSGVPTTDTAASSAGLAVAGAGVADAGRSSDQATRSIAEGAQASQQAQAAFRPSFLTVEVLGLGE